MQTVDDKLHKARKAFGQLMSNKQNVLATFEGTLGDGAGNVQVTTAGRENFVYVRINDHVQEIFNSRVPVQDGLKVIVGYESSQPELVQVLGTRSSTPYGESGRVVTHIAPATYYQWMGVDPIFIDKRLWLPRRVSLMYSADPAYDPLSVIIFPDTLWLGDTWFSLLYQIVDLSSYIPANVGKETTVLITIDTAGAIVCTKGAECDLGDMTLVNVPDIPADTHDVLAAVHVYEGQTEFVENLLSTDVLDLRFTYSSGGGGGHIIQDNGTPMTQRTNMNIIGATLEDDAVNDATKVTIPSTPGPATGGFPSWYVDGVLTTGTTVGVVFVAPFAASIISITAHLKTLGSAGSTIIDILVNGTTIFNPTSPPEIAYNAAEDFVTITPDVTALAEGDIVSLTITQVATNAASLSVFVNGSAPAGAAPSGANILQMQIFS